VFFFFQLTRLIKMKAWVFDEHSPDTDLRTPHQTSPPQPVSEKELAELGVTFERLPVDDWERRLTEYCQRHGFDDYETNDLSPQTVPQYDEKLKQISAEHIHDVDEARYVIEGGGYLDIRSKKDHWIRCWLLPGDLLHAVGGLYHRFSMDSSNNIVLRRLAKKGVGFDTIKRPCDDHPARQHYVTRFLSAVPTGTQK